MMLGEEMIAWKYNSGASSIARLSWQGGARGDSLLMEGIQKLLNWVVSIDLIQSASSCRGRGLRETWQVGILPRPPPTPLVI